MASPALKIAPAGEQQAPSTDALPAKSRRSRLRFVLLGVLPLLAILAALGVYLAGGGSISTDNAYIGAQKVLITPDVSGKISRVVVREGERVKSGDLLFEIDGEPFRLAVSQAEARLANVRTEFANLKTNLTAIERQSNLGEENVAIRQRDVDRKATLLSSRAGSQADVDSANAALVAARAQLDQLRQQAGVLRNQLLGDANLPVEQYPGYIQALAVLNQARRDLDHTVVKAPIAGMATQVDSIQLGRYVMAGTPVFSIIDDAHPWVDANPKETDITFLTIGQKVTISVDTFPGQRFHGTVASVSPGTGAQFAILPPQNASGNWVKVIQRVPVRIVFAPGDDVSRLRAGMSVTVDIDTGRKRSFGTLLGFSAPAAQGAD